MFVTLCLSFIYGLTDVVLRFVVCPVLGFIVYFLGCGGLFVVLFVLVTCFVFVWWGEYFAFDI